MSFRNESRDTRDLLSEIIRRLDDLERKRPPALGGEIPNIWTCTTMRRGATTWTSALNDTRTLTDNIARHATEGGVAIQPDVLSHYQVLPISGQEQFNGTDVVRYEIDLTTWWATPAGGALNEYSHPLLYDSFFRWALLPPGWWDGSADPPVPTISDGLGSPLANGIPLDPATVGASDWDRLYMRVEYNQATGATEAWLSTINDVTFNLVSQGTVTLAAAASGAGMDFEPRSGLSADAVGFAPSVLHGCIIDERESGGDGTIGQQLFGFQVNNVDMMGGRWTHGRNAPSNQIVGTANVSDGSFFYQSYLNDITIVPEGAPLWVSRPRDDIKPIWVDGPELADPAVAWARRNNPSKIFVDRGVQPAEWEVPTVGAPNDGAFVYAVVDLATAAGLDGNDWPLNWFPFGPLRAT